MQDFFENAQPRMMAILLISVVLLVVAGETVYLLWPPMKNFMDLRASHAVLEQAASNSDSLGKQLEKINAEVSSLSRQLHGDMAQLPEKEMESFVIGRLQKVSWATDVELISVKPGRGGQVQNFRESLFEVKVIAGYHDFFEWLQVINRELGYIVVKKFEINPEDRETLENPRLAFLLTLISYRMEQSLEQ